MLRIVEYIGPYGAGKSTRCRADARELKGMVYLSDDFYEYVSSATSAQKFWWIAKHAWRYWLTRGALLSSVEDGTLRDRSARARRLARKAIYLREFAGNREGLFLNDEGLLHGLCQAMTGAPGTFENGVLSFLFSGLDVRFFFVATPLDECKSRLAQRTRKDGANDRYREGTFLGMINSGNPATFELLVTASCAFYTNAIAAMANRWPVFEPSREALQQLEG